MGVPHPMKKAVPKSIFRDMNRDTVLLYPQNFILPGNNSNKNTYKALTVIVLQS
jgi:hypothetical protein